MRKMFKRLPYIPVLLALMAVAACIRDDAPRTGPSRVLFVYMGTDSNLSGYEQAKLQAIREGWTGKPNDRIIAYVDKGRGADARLIEISNLSPDEQPREIRRYSGELNNSASGQTLASVINEVTTGFPADSYGLLVFSHASGWLPQGVYNGLATGEIPDALLSSAAGETGISHFVATGGNGSAIADAPWSRSIVVDGNGEMEIADFAAAIPDGTFDYIVFETCFMAGIEVAWELRRKAPYIFASSAEIVHPGFASVYPSATASLIGLRLADFGESVFEHTLSYAETDPRRSATYSLIRTAELEALADFVQTNCDFEKEIDISEIQHFDRLKGHRLFFDFYDYHSRLLDSDALRTELARLLGNCIVWKRATDLFMTQAAGYNGFEISQHSGLTTYIRQDSYPGLDRAYGSLGWAKSVMP